MSLFSCPSFYRIPKHLEQHLLQPRLRCLLSCQIIHRTRSNWNSQDCQSFLGKSCSWSNWRHSRQPVWSFCQKGLVKLACAPLPWLSSAFRQAPTSFGLTFPLHGPVFGPRASFCDGRWCFQVSSARLYLYFYFALFQLISDLRECGHLWAIGLPSFVRQTWLRWLLQPSGLV